MANTKWNKEMKCAKVKLRDMEVTLTPRLDTRFTLQTFKHDLKTMPTLLEGCILSKI